MIKLVFPFSKVDVQLASLLANRMIKFGDMAEREILVTCCWEDHFGVEEFCKSLQPKFKKVDLFVMPDVPENMGWPEAPNHMFYNACMWLAKNGNTEPFYWFEADNFPLQPGWLDAFEQEYNSHKEQFPYMGFINETWFTVAGKSETRGKHMVGTGIYPANFLEICNRVHELTDIPFDIDIQDEVLEKCHHTNLIHHTWHTGQYFYKGNELIARPLNKFNRYGGPVNPESLVIHGCKDMSLYKLTLRPRKLPS